MSQKATRKGIVQEDKDKRQTDSPVKDMKKKMAANAEKEKQAAEKTPEKPADKADKTDKTDKTEKADKGDKTADKKSEKATEKKNETPSETPKEDSKVEKSVKTNQEQKKAEQSKPKQNGKQYNGVTDVTLSTNGGPEEVLNGTVSPDSDEEDAMLVIDDDHHDDELFPELTYDDTSDAEYFEPPTPENVPSRSHTRRSQVKVTRTPETPRPASEKPNEKDAPTDESKEKVLKLKEDVTGTDRKLRSADSPKPSDAKKQDKTQEPQPKKDEKVHHESPKASQEKASESPAKNQEKKDDTPKKKDKEESPKKKDSEKIESAKENGEKSVYGEYAEIVIDDDGQDEPRKTDTNYSKSRVKVSPYRRSMRLADQTTSSMVANYTGNNTTMEMDITESSLVSESVSLEDSYLSGLRNIRGRRSYKLLGEIPRHITNRSLRSNTSHTLNLSEPTFRPTAPVVGRKRKPDSDETSDTIEPAAEAEELTFGRKRMRLLDRIAHPFRKSLASTPLPRRAAEIVGINTDLPLSAPFASAPDTFDPESLKPSTSASSTLETPTPVSNTERTDKRCIVM